MNYSPFVKGLNSAIMTLCTLIMITLSAQSYFQDSLFKLLSINTTILLAGANLACIIITFALSRYEKKLNEDEDPCEGIEESWSTNVTTGTSGSISVDVPSIGKSPEGDPFGPGNCGRGEGIYEVGPDGRIEFENMETGSTWVITEIEAPAGYVLNSTPQTVKIVDDVTTVTIRNDQKPGLLLIKEDEDTGTHHGRKVHLYDPWHEHRLHPCDG